VWTGRQALANGLVDELGSLDDAVKAAAKLGHLPSDKEPELLLLPKHKSFFDALLERGSDASDRLSVLQPLAKEMPELARALRGVGGMLQLRGEPVWLTLPYRVEFK
jgi:protease-4